MVKQLLIFLLITLYFLFTHRSFSVGGLIITSSAYAEEKLYFIHQDHLGSTSMVTDESGNVISKQSYYPYGSTRLVTQLLNHSVTKNQYTSQISDVPQTDLYYYNARYYSPGIGIFTQADTHEGPNRYAYVNGNPIRYTDPSGNVSPLPPSLLKFLERLLEPYPDEVKRPTNVKEGCEWFAAKVINLFGGGGIPEWMPNYDNLVLYLTPKEVEAAWAASVFDVNPIGFGVEISTGTRSLKAILKSALGLGDEVAEGMEVAARAVKFKKTVMGAANIAADELRYFSEMSDWAQKFRHISRSEGDAGILSNIVTVLEAGVREVEGLFTIEDFFKNIQGYAKLRGTETRFHLFEPGLKELHGLSFYDKTQNIIWLDFSLQGKDVFEQIKYWAYAFADMLRTTYK